MIEINLKIDRTLSTINVSFLGRRLVIVPKLDSIYLNFKRVVTKDEKIELVNDPRFKLLTSGTKVTENRIVETTINLSYDAAYVMCHVLETHQKEIREIQILNIITEPYKRSEASEILINATKDEFDLINGCFENKDYDGVLTLLSNVKKRLVNSGEMENSENDYFN